MNKLCGNKQYEFRGLWNLSLEEFETYILKRFSKQKNSEVRYQNL